MQRLSPIDSAFLQMESTRTPMHVGCLLTFHMPEIHRRIFSTTWSCKSGNRVSCRRLSTVAW